MLAVSARDSFVATCRTRTLGLFLTFAYSPERPSERLFHSDKRRMAYANSSNIAAVRISWTIWQKLAFEQTRVILRRRKSTQAMPHAKTVFLCGKMAVLLFSIVQK